MEQLGEARLRGRNARCRRPDGRARNARPAAATGCRSRITASLTEPTSVTMAPARSAGRDAPADLGIGRERRGDDDEVGALDRLGRIVGDARRRCRAGAPCRASRRGGRRRRSRVAEAVAPQHARQRRADQADADERDALEQRRRSCAAGQELGDAPRRRRASPRSVPMVMRRCSRQAVAAHLAGQDAARLQEGEGGVGVARRLVGKAHAARNCRRSASSCEAERARARVGSHGSQSVVVRARAVERRRRPRARRRRRPAPAALTLNGPRTRFSTSAIAGGQ